MPVRSFRDLIVWQRAVELTEECYRLTASLPAVERYGLAGQIRRAAISVPAHIAEGFARRTKAEYLRLLSASGGSLAELETHLLLLVRLGYLPPEAIVAAAGKADEVGRMLRALSDGISRAMPRGREERAKR
jgi:four helix bundle protein